MSVESVWACLEPIETLKSFQFLAFAAEFLRGWIAASLKDPLPLM